MVRDTEGSKELTAKVEVLSCDEITESVLCSVISLTLRQGVETKLDIELIAAFTLSLSLTFFCFPHFRPIFKKNLFHPLPTLLSCFIL